MSIRSAILFTLILIGSLRVSAQTYYAFGDALMYRIDIDLDTCDNACSITEVGPSNSYSRGVAFCPNGNLYGYTDNEIHLIDPATGIGTIVFQDLNASQGVGLVCAADSLLYTFSMNSDQLVQFNLNTGITTVIGTTPFYIEEEITAFDSQYFYQTLGSIVQLDIQNPVNSTAIMNFDIVDYFFAGLTGSAACNTLIGINIRNTDELVAINLAEQSLTHVCYLPVEASSWQITSPVEFADPICQAQLDLDCDDSSGALDANFNAGTYDCLSDSIRIADDDIKIINDDRILTMTINMLNPRPDDPYEDLVMSISVPGIQASGLGTPSVTLSNEGTATAEDFKAALQAIYYVNTTLNPTPGPRVIQVQFTTESGLTSNIAASFFIINALPVLDVDLGPDQLICDGESTTFDAGYPGATYAWSTSENTQSINTSLQGSYTVTVSDGINCPGVDTALLTLMPNIDVALIGDLATCQNSPASLTLVTNAMIPIDIEVSISTGGTYSFQNVTGNLSFAGNPSTTTTYEITSVTADQPFCLNMTDSLQTVQVFPTYFSEMHVGLCGGDSIWLAYYWEHNAGVYNIQLNSEYGCDSTVLYTIESVPADFILIETNTCDPSAAGIFITTLPNANGCDTIVQNTITLQLPDTTSITSTTCRISEAGTDTITLSNVYGCDSLVISGIAYIPPSDTTLIITQTCDPSQVDEVLSLWTGADGCDSLVLTVTELASTDTTRLFGSSCDPSMIGVSMLIHSGSDGCDSVVIVTTTAIPSDTTYINITSCDSAQLGTTTTLLSNSIGCDSLIITTVSFSQQDTSYLAGTTCDQAMAGTTYASFVTPEGCDSIVATTLTWISPVDVFITSSSCDPSAVGTFIDTLTGHLGCDSIVHEEVSLLPSNTTNLFETTCASTNAGVFTTVLTNQYGCDSTVILTVTLLPADTTWIFSKTCFAADVDTIATTLTDQIGCDSVVLNAVSLFETTTIALESVFDYHGYDVSCLDADDGAIIATVSGTSPYAFAWSTGDDEQDLDNVAAGAYTVTVTDGNGCQSSHTIELLAPPGLTALFEVDELPCNANQGGSVVITANGGVPSYQYAVVGSAFQDGSILTGLANGIHVCVVKDANDCEFNGIIRIDIPLISGLELGEDQIINNGESATIEASISISLDSLTSLKWYSPSEELCDGCITLSVTPLVTTVYYAEATTVDGCIALDSITIHVIQDKEVYIPNVFSPNGDGINDRLDIMTKPNVTSIARMEIFDRWGNAVYAKSNITPNDADSAWDGTWNKKSLNPGVFVYRILVEFIDGSQALFKGDITLIR